MFNKGRQYRHFKGGVYTIEDFANDCETLERVVVYRSNETQKLWVRSYKDFFGYKTNGSGESVRRFAPLKNAEDLTKS